jgi:hypothetical protein
MINRALGTPEKYSKDLSQSRELELNFIATAATAFAQTYGPLLDARGKIFRFVYLSKQGAQLDTNNSQDFLSQTKVSTTCARPIKFHTKKPRAWLRTNYWTYRDGTQALELLLLGSDK